MTNTSIALIAKDLLNLVLGNVKFICAVSLVFLLFGIYFSTTLTPTFRVYAEIQPKQSDSVSGDQNSLVSLITQGSNQKGGISYFRSNMMSSVVAKNLWNLGYSDIFYSTAYDPILESYQSSASIWQEIKSKILGYEINKTIDHQNLSEMIEGIFQFQEFKNSSSIIVYTLQSDPRDFKLFLEDILEQTDNHIKETRLSTIGHRIDFLTSKIQATSEVTLRTSLLTLLEKTLLEEILLSDNAFYSIEVIDPPQVSKNPSFINLQFIYFGFLFLGFALAIVWLFIKKEFL